MHGAGQDVKRRRVVSTAIEGFRASRLKRAPRGPRDQTRRLAGNRREATPREIGARNDTATALEQGRFLQRRAAPLLLDVVADHVLHAVEVAGVDHVGIGSDYDGIGRTPQGLEDASCYQNLGARLRERGLDAHDVAKILSGNMQRVFDRATGPGTQASRISGEKIRIP